MNNIMHMILKMFSVSVSVYKNKSYFHVRHI